MAGANDILRVIAALLLLVILPFIGAVGIQLLDPIYKNVIDPAEMKRLGWGSPQDTLFLFATLAMFALLAVVVLWMIFAPARDDVRQSGGPPI